MKFLVVLATTIVIAGCSGQDGVRIDSVVRPSDGAADTTITPQPTEDGPQSPDASVVADATVDDAADAALDATSEPTSPPTDSVEEEAMAPDDVAAEPGAPTDSVTPDATPDEGDATDDVDAHDDIDGPLGPDAPTCPALPPRDGGTPPTAELHCCGGLTCSTQRNCTATTCSACNYDVLLDGPLFDLTTGANRDVYLLLPESPSCSARIIIAANGETGCFRITTSAGRTVIRQPNPMPGPIPAPCIVGGSGGTMALITDAGAPMGWTIFESARLVGNTCPLVCP